MHDDVSTMAMLLAAQNAGNGGMFIHEIMVPGALAAVFVVAIILVAGIVWFIFGSTNDPRQDFYYPGMTERENYDDSERSSHKK